MRHLFLTLALGAIAGPGFSGDWGKAPLDKVAPVQECVDLGGTLSTGYHTDYIYKGLLVGGDSVVTNLTYDFEGLLLPVTLGVRYANVIATNRFANTFNDDLAVSGRVKLPTVAKVETALSYTHRFYPEDPNTSLWPSSHGEVGFHAARELGIAVVTFDVYYNSRLPNAWNGTIPTLGNPDDGAWYWDLGLHRRFEILGQGLVLAGGVAYSDNYWGQAPNFQTGGRSSGWNHYYATASLPIDLNCRAQLTPYIGYLGAPEGWLMDGAPDWANRPAQSDLLHGGVNLSVSF